MILDKIIQHKRKTLSTEYLNFNVDLLLDQTMLPALDFPTALESGNLSIISEIKRKSPSAGLIKRNFDPELIANQYMKNNTSAISVLTEDKFFGGRNEYIQHVKDATHLPTLRKDFIISEYQIYESKFIGADAILLIVRILSDAELNHFIQLAKRLNLYTLVEVHSRQELDRALHAGAKIIGINNRDLDTLQINLSTSFELIKNIPKDIITVSESGIKTRADVIRLEVAGFDAALIGEILMKANHPGQKLREIQGLDTCAV